MNQPTRLDPPTPGAGAQTAGQGGAGSFDIVDPQDLAVPGNSTDPRVVARHARHLSALALLYLRHAAAPRAMVLGLAAMAMGDLRPQTILLVAEALLQAGDPEQALTVLGRLDLDGVPGADPAGQPGAQLPDAMAQPGEPQVEGPVTDYHLAARDFLTARVLMRRGDVDSAREAFDRAIERASMLPPLNMDDDDTDTPAEARA